MLLVVEFLGGNTISRVERLGPRFLLRRLFCHIQAVGEGSGKLLTCQSIEGSVVLNKLITAFLAELRPYPRPLVFECVPLPWCPVAAVRLPFVRVCARILRPQFVPSIIAVVLISLGTLLCL